MPCDHDRLTNAFDGFQKRSGLIVPFSWQKIELAIDRAVDEVSRKHSISKNEGLSSKVAGQVLQQLTNPTSEFYVHPEENGKRIPKIEDVQDLVEILLAENGETLTVAAYKRYRKQRELARRNIRVRDGGPRGDVDVTDASVLLVESTSNNVNLPWDRKRIVKQILDKTDLSVELAISVAKSVENRIIGSEMSVINTTLIRELVNNELMERGHSQQLRDLSLYRVSKDYLERLMFANSKGDSHTVNNNPEAVNLGIAEFVLKQWALGTVFSQDVKRAHDIGALHIHDLGHPTRVHSASHSIEYVKKYGLAGLDNLNTSSSPARSASVLTGQINTFLASIQANYAGALRLPHTNILYAPFLKGMDENELIQAAQELIFSGSQNAFSRGGQALPLELNIHTGIPAHLKSVPAVGPGGHYQLRLKDGTVVELIDELRKDTDDTGHHLMDLYYQDPVDGMRLVLRELTDETDGVVFDPAVVENLLDRGETIVTYGDYAAESQAFCRALLHVFSEGDTNGFAFQAPKCHFHITEETFDDPVQFAIYRDVCAHAGQNGSIYFVFDRNEGTRTECIQRSATRRMEQHPESIRTCEFQHVTINIPQAAYRAARTGGDILSNFYNELDRTMDLAVDAHLQKKAKTEEMMSGPNHPLWQIGKAANDGRPYVDLESSTYILGLTGVNDAVNFLFGQELHENPDAQRLGLRIIAHMSTRAKKLAKKHNLAFTLGEPASENASHRLAKSDAIYFAEESNGTVKGAAGSEYYSDSVNLSYEAEISPVERIFEESKYNCMIESGTVTRFMISGERPASEPIAQLMTEVFFRTQAATVCASLDRTCGNTSVPCRIRSERYEELLNRHTDQRRKTVKKIPAEKTPALAE